MTKEKPSARRYPRPGSPSASALPLHRHPPRGGSDCNLGRLGAGACCGGQLAVLVAQHYEGPDFSGEACPAGQREAFARADTTFVGQYFLFGHASTPLGIASRNPPGSMRTESRRPTFVLAHELGHVMAGHTTAGDRTAWLRPETIPAGLHDVAAEIEADVWRCKLDAGRHVGRTASRSEVEARLFAIRIVLHTFETVEECALIPATRRHLPAARRWAGALDALRRRFSAETPNATNSSGPTSRRTSSLSKQAHCNLPTHRSAMTWEPLAGCRRASAWSRAHPGPCGTNWGPWCGTTAFRGRDSGGVGWFRGWRAPMRAIPWVRTPTGRPPGRQRPRCSAPAMADGIRLRSWLGIVGRPRHLPTSSAGVA